MTETSRVVVRSFQPSEWPLYRVLRLRALEEDPQAFGASSWATESARSDDEWAERLREAVDDVNAFPALAEIDTRPAGLAWGRIVGGEPDAAHLYQMWVAPEARGAGVGLQLVNDVVDWARAAGAREIRLGVTDPEGAAARLYRRAGFRLGGGAGGCSEFGTGCHAMMLTL